MILHLTTFLLSPYNPLQTNSFEAHMKKSRPWAVSPSTSVAVSPSTSLLRVHRDNLPSKLLALVFIHMFIVFIVRQWPICVNHLLHAKQRLFYCISCTALQDKVLFASFVCVISIQVSVPISAQASSLVSINPAVATKSTNSTSNIHSGCHACVLRCSLSKQCSLVWDWIYFYSVGWCKCNMSGWTPPECHLLHCRSSNELHMGFCWDEETLFPRRMGRGAMLASPKSETSDASVTPLKV